MKTTAKIKTGHLKSEKKATEKALSSSMAKKQKAVSTRINEDLFSELEQEAKDLGYKNISEYVREILIGRKREENVATLLKYKLYLISKIGNNINQIAKQINTDMKNKGEINHHKTCDIINEYIDELKFLMN